MGIEAQLARIEGERYTWGRVSERLTDQKARYDRAREQIDLLPDTVKKAMTMSKTPQYILDRIEEAKVKKLKKLNLNWDWSEKKLTEIPAEVFELQYLEELELRSHQIKVVPERIRQLKKLRRVDLISNYLNHISEEIGRLPQLTKLDLGYNQLRELPESLGKLQQLTELNLSENQLTSLPDSLGNLRNLTTLNLSGNQLTSVPESLASLKHLTELDLSGNQLRSLPELLGSLQHLTTLHLSRNQLTSLPEWLLSLKNLSALYLSYNQFIIVPEWFGGLQSLTMLDLSYNQLRTMPDSIGELIELTEMNLSNNKIIIMPESLGKLKNIQNINLSNNDLITIPKPMGAFSDLRVLVLYNNKLTSLPEWLGSLPQLTTLDLSINQLKELPDSLIHLQNLTKLYLSHNKLTSIPDCVYKLHSLEEFRLENRDWALGAGNQIKEISPKILQLINLRELRLDGNSIEIPPPELVAKGFKAIKDYFRQLEEKGLDYLYEAKLLIVGEPGAGKTSLAKKISDPNYALDPNEPTTHGIDVIEWQFKMTTGQPFRVNIWDFGGQEIYYATHQFFLTKRSLYVLVCDARQVDTHFYYWLNVVELLSHNSPLFIVKNEKQGRERNIPERLLRERFTNLKDTLATNLATNRGLLKILKTIQHSISTLPHIGTALPKTWVNVREVLEQDPRYHIRLDEYFEICKAHGFSTEQDALQLSDFLHDLGVILHFQEDKNSPLYKTVILKPEWGTTAVYRVLDNQKVKANLGQFSWADLDEIWQEVKYANMQGELLELMLKFKLCYKIEQSQQYIAPQLLDPNPPDYEWDSQDNLLLRYTYHFMPMGIMTRFIVVMHKWIFLQQQVWRSGVILEKDKTKAEVIEDLGKREIRIRIVGQNKKGLMEIVTYELDQIHASYHRLKSQKLIPCNCVTCKGSQEPHFYHFEKLVEFVANGRYSERCDKKPYEYVDILSLIDNISHKKEELPRPAGGQSSLLREIRQRLKKAFDNVGLDAFCLDNFEEVFDQFTEGMRLDAKINLLLAYSRRQPNGLQKLLNLIDEYSTMDF